VLEDVLAAYSALSRGAAPQLAHRPPYRQYVAWLRSQDMTRAERFWRRGLAGFAAPTPLAVDRLALVPPGRGSGSRELYLPADASGRLRAFARQHRLTLNTLVQGAWAILLSRHAGRDDVVFGTTVSGRPVELPRVEAIVGMFANNLPVRTRVAPDGAVLTWLRSFQDELAQVRHYEHCSPQQVQAWGGVPWSVRLYDTLVVFQNYPAERSPGTGPAAGLKIEPYHGRLETNLPLTLVAIAQDRLKLRLLYQRRRFDDATAEGLLDQLRDLLDAVTTRPDLPAPELARAGAAAAVEAGDGRPPGIVRILGDLSRSAPDAVAVACGDAALSRAALADRVRRLAGDLEARGLRPGDVAALCPEPGVDQVVALLAVLETGDAAAQAAPLADVCAALARRLDLGTHQVWLAAAPLWETGGVDVLAALLAGTRVELPEPREGLAPVLRRSRSTIVLSTPGQWKDLLAAGCECQRHRIAVTCGEVPARGLADLLLTRFSSLWAAFGTPQLGACAALWRIPPGDGPIAVRDPVGGTRIEVLDRHRRPAPAGVPGEVRVNGAATGIGARRLPDGGLELLGRGPATPGEVGRGEVEALLRRRPETLEAAVADVDDGERVAYLAVGPAPPFDHAAARRDLRRALPEATLPSTFVVLPALPRTPGGCIDRAALPPADTSGGRVLHSLVPPRDPLQLELAQIWEELLDVRPIGIRDEFFALGGHSLLAVRLMVRIRERFEEELPLATLFQYPTIEKLAELLSRRGNAPRSSALVPIQPRGTKRPFFCVHGIGGEVLIYYQLARCLGEDQPFYGIQAPSAAELADRFTPLEEMARGYLERIRAVQPQGPYALGGYSFGAVVAFEMAQQLVARGEPVRLIALLDGTSPLIVRRGARRSDAAVLAGLARNRARQAGVDLALDHERLARLPLDEAIDHTLAELRGAGLAPPEIDPAWVRRLIAGVRLREESVHRYEPRKYPGVITLFRSTESEQESAKAWREVGVDATDRTRGWDALAGGRLEVREVPGYHATLLSRPHVRALARQLGACLNETSCLNEASRAAEEAAREKAQAVDPIHASIPRNGEMVA